MTDTNKKTISVTLPHWVLDNVIGQTDNRSQRIQELLTKGSMVETLEEATGQSFKQLVRGKAKAGDKHSRPNDSGGIGSHSVGCLFNQWSQFIYNNPWTAKSIGDTES